MLEKNKIKEVIDDNIYLTVKYEKNIEYLTEKSKIGAIGGQTPVQIQLPHSMFNKKSDILLLVKDSNLFHIKKAVEESPYLSQTIKHVSSFKEFSISNKNQLK
jgi:hypothetical protein